MNVLDLPGADPYRNLAAEEYFLKEKSGDWFILWQNAPCIVVGRNQNTHAEINREYVEKENLAVVRRLTGGGAVYHDAGNLNYTVIRENAADLFGNYAAFCDPLIAALREMGVPAKLSGRNDLLAEGKKFCGNAQTMWRGRILHHGCILFNADLSRLSGALRVHPLKIQSKGIKSVRSRVVNLSAYLPGIAAKDFRRELYGRVLQSPENTEYILTEEDRAAIEALRLEKYSTYEWNFGYNKPFGFQKDTLFPGGLVTVRMNIRENRIASFEIRGDFFGVRQAEELERLLEGAPYEPDAIRERLSAVSVSEYIAGVDTETFIRSVF